MTGRRRLGPNLYVGGAGEAEGEPALMDLAVMEGAEQDQVVERRAAAVQPVLDVVPVKKAVVCAAWEPAPLVADPQRAPNGGGNGPRATPDIQHRALIVHGDGDQSRIARHPPERFRGNVRSILQSRPQRGLR